VNKDVFHPLAILALAIFWGHGPWLMAQTDSRSSGGAPKTGRDFRSWRQPSMKPGVVAGQTGEKHPGAVEMGLAQKKNYEWRTVDYPAASESYISDYADGIAGGYYQLNSESAQIAFYFKGKVNYLLNVPGAVDSSIEGINGTGQMVGGYDDSNGVSHGFWYNGKTVSKLDVPGATGTTASDISNSGLIVGSYWFPGYNYGFVDDNGILAAVAYPGSYYTFATGINASGVIVGYYESSDGRIHGFQVKYKTGFYTSFDFPQASLTYAVGVNDAGVIAGWFFDENANAVHGFLYSGGVFTQVDVPDAQRTYLNRIKNNGNVVGYLEDAEGAVHGVIGK